MREWKRFFLLVSQYMSSMCMRIFWNDHVCQWRYIFRYISKYHIVLFLKKMWPHEDHFMPFVFMDFTFIYSCSLFHTICFILPTRLHFFFIWYCFTFSQLQYVAYILKWPYICCMFYSSDTSALFSSDTVSHFHHINMFFITMCAYLFLQL